MTDTHTMRPIAERDLAAMLALLPQLADFEIPPKRNAEDLWRSDAKLLRQVVDSGIGSSFSEVAVNADDIPLGLILVTMRDELMSHAPSAHLEAIVVAPAARGTGVGRALLQHAEDCAKQRGAESLSLHVFANNQRARNLYNQQGYDSELIRATKWFT